MKKVVHKNDGSVPVDEILCTTYQMRNFYRQLGDGFFSDLDVMNYIQHFAAVHMMRQGMNVLDVCCGRNLLLPFMRYYAKDVKKYIGVDIESKNPRITKDIRNNKPVDPQTFWPFDVEIIISNVAEMAPKIKDPIHLVVYTSAIEHMHKEHGANSLRECSKVMVKGAKLFLSCPNTPEWRDGFNVQYKAHVYEWKISELQTELKKNGFQILNMYGLTGSISHIKNAVKKMPKPLQKHYQMIIDYMPKEFLTSFLFLPLPHLSKEVLIIAQKL